MFSLVSAYIDHSIDFYRHFIIIDKEIYIIVLYSCLANARIFPRLFVNGLDPLRFKFQRIDLFLKSILKIKCSLRSREFLRNIDNDIT